MSDKLLPCGCVRTLNYFLIESDHNTSMKQFWPQFCFLMSALHFLSESEQSLPDACCEAESLGSESVVAVPSDEDAGSGSERQCESEQELPGGACCKLGCLKWAMSLAGIEHMLKIKKPAGTPAAHISEVYHAMKTLADESNLKKLHFGGRVVCVHGFTHVCGIGGSTYSRLRTHALNGCSDPPQDLRTSKDHRFRDSGASAFDVDRFLTWAYCSLAEYFPDPVDRGEETVKMRFMDLPATEENYYCLFSMQAQARQQLR